MTRGYLGLFVAAAIGACSSDSETSDGGVTFDPGRYDRTCATAADCVAVYSGDPCGCDCAQIAVAASEKSQVIADQKAYREAHCAAGPPDCGPCPQTPATTCEGGKCGLAQ